MAAKKVTDLQLKEARDHYLSEGLTPTSERITEYLYKKYRISVSDATVRGRFIEMNEPLSGKANDTLQEGDRIQIKEELRKNNYTLNAIGNCGTEIDMYNPKRDSHGIFVSTAKDYDCEYDDTDIYIAQMTDGISGNKRHFLVHKDWIEKCDKTEATQREKEQAKLRQTRRTITPEKHKSDSLPPELKNLIPTAASFTGYIERETDEMLAMHYDLQANGYDCKYPLTQGKQGTGKTLAHAYYAHKRNVPFILISCHEDMKINKLFGDRTIKNGSVKFQESVFVRAIQQPSVVLFDEVNALSQANTFDLHALLQNRQLFVKDADDGKGKIYKLHQKCRIGFAQNPKSRKYIGGNIRASNFLGRCTYITFPEFTAKNLKKLLKEKYPELEKDERKKFVKFYQAVNKAIQHDNIPVDVSIRQLLNTIDLFLHGMHLKIAIEQGMTSITESASQASSKEALDKIAEAVWEKLK